MQLSRHTLVLNLVLGLVSFPSSALGAVLLVETELATMSRVMANDGHVGLLIKSRSEKQLRCTATWYNINAIGAAAQIPYSRSVLVPTNIQQTIQTGLSATFNEFLTCTVVQ